jgi:hypothetical protein
MTTNNQAHAFVRGGFYRLHAVFLRPHLLAAVTADHARKRNLMALIETRWD